MEKIQTHEIDLDRKYELLEGWNIKDSLKKDVKSFLKDYSLGKITQRIGTNNPGTTERLLASLKPALENLDSLDKKDLENFLDELMKDKIKSKLKRPFTLRSKMSILDTLRRFVIWKGKDASILKVRIKHKKSDPRVLTEEEVSKLYDSLDNPKYQYFISILYSSGCRAEEFHNIRYSDIEMPKGQDNYVKITLRNEYSKTNGRTISLHWKNTLQAVKSYLNQRINDGIKPEEPVFPIKYVSMRKWLQRLGKRILNKPINYHLFRHSRATHLADKLNRQQLCVYFGWDFSSPMPDVYINRSGVNFREIDEKFDKTEREELNQKVELQQRQIEEMNKVLYKLGRKILKKN